MESLQRSPSFDLSWDSRHGALHLVSPGRDLQLVPGVEVVQGGHARVLSPPDLTSGRVSQDSVEDPQGNADQIGVLFQEAHGVAPSFRVRLYPARPFALAQVAVTNVGPQPVSVRRFFVRTLPGGICARGEPIGVYLNGWQSESPAGFSPLGERSLELPFWCRPRVGAALHNARTPWGSRRLARWASETVGAVITPDEALVMGGVSLADQFVQVLGHLEPTWSEHCMVLVQSQADELPLAVGASVSSEWFYMEWVPLPNGDPLAQYAYAVMRQMAVTPPRPAVTGWCSSHLSADRVAESDVMENLASAALLADEFPLHVIQLDAGYQAPSGDWDQLNERFPHDLKWLADRITGSRFEAGLRLSPLLVHSSSSLVREHPDCLLRGSNGKPVSVGLLPDEGGRALDPTHPAVGDYLRIMVDRVVREWGYSYLKLDRMYAGALPGVRYAASTTRAQALREAFRIIREAAGPSTYLVGCGSPLAPAIGLVDAMQVSPDTAPQWNPSHSRLRRWFMGGPVTPCLRHSLRSVLARGWIHNRWWANDTDALLLRDDRTQLTKDEVLTQLTLLGLSGGPVVLSDDLDNLLPERRALAAVLFPQLLDGMDVLDLFESAMPETVVVPVARPWGRWQLVGLFNWQSEPAEVMLPEPIRLDIRKSYHLVDFWEHHYIQLRPGALRPVFHLAPHGTSLLSIRSVSPDPHLVTTTFHISQGGEVSTCKVDGGSMTLSIALGRVASGEIWLSLPARPKSVTVGDQQLPPAMVRAVASGIWAVSCSIDHSAVLTVEWEAPNLPGAL